ncbi:glycosyltransferase [Flavobacteriaceae bacterium S0825]|uniref:glycosyltransferase n=1 Tax=Gaetbulibacter sp. S0825 TaxID=2720084 RepID=UPI00142F9D8B|nr:glycosyltransferase [Gaetbulibacter sp. S0825]MCK0107939.1 glycosyltransferase [Flavobacteriaceae bacterium S0825]NIX63575.1 glycosyltransferase [Gaetbulibacter sp. S0825]
MSKRILIAPLNWGLGHATRCIPIINALLINGFVPIIASDGNALSLLKKEFPELEFIELPSYNIEYSKKGSRLKFKLLKDAPKILRAIKKEHHIIQDLVVKNKIVGIISDNRFGVYSKKIPSVYLTHQLNVLSGNTTLLSTKLHQKTIKKFDECWIPDYRGHNNLSGVLSHSENSLITIKRIGALSRLNKIDLQQKYDLMVLLSGPEPQRTLLEEKLLLELNDYNGKVIFIKGVVESEQKVTTQNNIIIYNYMISTQLETAINESKLVLSRSGYTTIMDLAKLEKKAFFIPTPGQFEQEYLAKYLAEKHITPFSNQKDFTIEKLNDVIQYQGFSDIENKTNYKELFALFERK